MTKHISIFTFAILTFGNTYAQDAHFSQLYANRLYLNPALTGIETQPELHVQYRNQWPSLAANYQTANFSYDQKIENINSGIGAILMYDKQGPALSEYSLGINYAYHLEINDDIKLHFGTQLLYAWKQLDWTKLSFGDMIDPRRGFIYQTGDVYRGNGRGYMDLSFGLAGEMKGFFFGGSIHHVNQPDVSLILGESKLPIRFSIHGGYNFNIKIGTDENTRILTLSPHVFYQNQNGFQMLTYGFYSNFRGATLGAFMRRDADLVFILGYDFNALRVAYSYDYVTSQLTNQSGGSHEISLTYRIGADFKARTEKSHQFPTF
jgi:type IX secretion system PorP/SprF family membrane protein